MGWRPGLRSSAADEEGEDSLLVDPTSALLEQVGDVESRIPWVPIGLVLILLLWLPTLGQLGSPPVPAEQAWVEEALTPWDPAGSGSAFARLLSRATWEWQGIEVEPGAELTAAQWRALRIPSAIASLVGLVVVFLLGRLVTGSAGALLATALLATAAPWTRAGSTALPFLIGELLVLLGVVWAVHLQARHREVEVARVSAARIGLAGVLLGLGLLLMPAAFATFLTTLVVWLFLGLRRSSSEATTLPVESPATNAFLAVFGTFVLFGAALIAAWGAERLAGGSGFPLAGSFGASVTRGVELWTDLYRMLLSPGPTTDWLVVVALPAIFALRWIEWGAGRPWQAAGLLPWLFFGVYLWALRHDAIRAGADGVPALELPITTPPLFVLGFGWLILRGFHTGRIRRQEYTFLGVWLVMAALWIPFVPAAHRHDPLLAAMVGLLPAALLVAGRAGRALWESEEPVLARFAIFVIGYLPILAAGLVRAATMTAPDAAIRRAADALQGNLIPVLLGAVVLGILSEFVTVRPELVAVPDSSGERPPSRRRGRRGGRRRRAPGGKTGGGRGTGRRSRPAG